MKKKTIFAAIILLISIAAVVISIKYEQSVFILKEKPTLEYTDEMILAGGYFDVIAPADENRHLPSDVESYSLGDGYVHLVLPTAVSERDVVIYIRDAQGNYLARRVCDFREDNMVGDWKIVLDRPNLPTLFFETDSHESFEEMLSSETTDLLCYGDMQICVDADEARKNRWYSEYLSVERGGKITQSAALQGRGSSSWDCDVKKSFTLRLNKSINLLGMGNYSNWNLIGCAYDPSLLKNTVINSLATRVGVKYQPSMQYINLYVDGKYQGVYILTTKVAVGKNRVALAKHDYLYKMDAPMLEQPILYNSKTWFCDGNDYPVADLVYPRNASEKVKNDAQEKLQRAIDAIEDPEYEGLDEIIDIESFAKYYWVQEATMNFDAWQRSVYMYYSFADGKMHLGPVWDMDITLGSPYEKAGMTFDSPEGYKVRNAGWYSELFKRDDFNNAVLDVYYNGGTRQALFETVTEFVDERQRVGDDGVLNFIMFGHANQGTTIMYGPTYDEYCANMIDFYAKRILWIDDQMGSNPR